MLRDSSSQIDPLAFKDSSLVLMVDAKVYICQIKINLVAEQQQMSRLQEVNIITSLGSKLQVECPPLDVGKTEPKPKKIWFGLFFWFRFSFFFKKN